MISSSTCTVCGYIFPDDRPQVPCPNCGGMPPTYNELLEGKLDFHTGLRVRQRRPGFPGWLVDMVNRVKRSWHGILARKTLIIDRSNPEKTVKTHRVEERQPDNSWKTVHDHTDECKAKRRPK